VEKLKQRLSPEMHLSTAVEHVSIRDRSVRVRTASGETHDFDKCVIATHADQAANVLDESLSDLRNQLKKFKYQKNYVCLHTDSTIMPSTRGNWASWNYRLDKTSESSSIHYWMNNLQPLETSTNYFISLNSADIVEQSSVKHDLVYHHPLFTLETNRARQVLEHHNLTADSIFFCGSYFGFGFHEDALRSAHNVADSLSQPTHWSSDWQNNSLESHAKDGVL
jgi:predicted NAD/FAD-binding protein